MQIRKRILGVLFVLALTAGSTLFLGGCRAGVDVGADSQQAPVAVVVN